MAAKDSVSSTNLAGALCYIPFVGFVAAIVWLLVQKSQGVKWHAVQSLLVSLAWLVLVITLGITFKGLVTVVVLALQLYLAVKAYQGVTVKLPLLGSWTDKILKRV